MKAARAGIVFAFSLSTTSLAFAQAQDPEALFKEGSALMEQGKYDEALAKLEAAQKADPGIGTLFNIAICHQKLGKLGSSYRELREVANLARVTGKKVREEAARSKLEELKTEAPAFAIAMATQDSDVMIRIDGAQLSRDDLGYYPVDDGSSHTIEATASSKLPWSKQVPTPTRGTLETISVPALSKPTVTVTTMTTETTDTRRTLGFLFGGIGIAGAITAGVTGVMLLNDKSTADEDCKAFDASIQKNRCTTAEGSSAVNEGRTLLPINAVAWGVAALGIGAGVYLLVTSGKKTAAVVPTIGGAAVVGRF